jgi:hypothetical protein
MHTIEDVFMTVYGPHDRPVKDRVVSTRVRVDDFSAELNLLPAPTDQCHRVSTSTISICLLC